MFFRFNRLSSMKYGSVAINANSVAMAEAYIVRNSAVEIRGLSKVVQTTSYVAGAEAVIISSSGIQAAAYLSRNVECGIKPEVLLKADAFRLCYPQSLATAVSCVEAAAAYKAIYEEIEIHAVSGLPASPYRIYSTESEITSSSRLSAEAFSISWVEAETECKSALELDVFRARYPYLLVFYGMFNKMGFNRRFGYKEPVIGVSHIEETVYWITYAEAEIHAVSGLSATPYRIYSAESEIIGASYLSAEIFNILWAGSEIPCKSVLESDVFRVRYANHNIYPYGFFNKTYFNRREFRKNGLFSFSNVAGSITTDSMIASELQSKVYCSAPAYKFMFPQANLNSRSSIEAGANVSWKCSSDLKSMAYIYGDAHVIVVEIIEFTNLNFKPGDIITIDLCNYYAEQNGQNIMDKYSGKFFRFYPENNKLIWHDDTISRQVEMKITFQNRYI